MTITPSRLQEIRNYVSFHDHHQGHDPTCSHCMLQELITVIDALTPEPPHSETCDVDPETLTWKRSFKKGDRVDVCDPCMLKVKARENGELR